MSYLHLENEITSCVKMGSLWEDRCSLTKGVHSNTIIPLIKTITKFLNVIGYQQPDLSINWTVYTHHACNWTVHVILRMLLRCTLLSKLLCFSAFITTFNRSALNRWFVHFSNFVIVLINW